MNNQKKLTINILLEVEIESDMEAVHRIQIECAVRKMIEGLAERNLLYGVNAKIEHQQPK